VPVPVVGEILPNTGPRQGGTRVVILGSNFVNCACLKVKFEDVTVPATFHEDRTIIATTPPFAVAKPALVSVTNDDCNWVAASCHFYFQ